MHDQLFQQYQDFDYTKQSFFELIVGQKTYAPPPSTSPTPLTNTF